MSPGFSLAQPKKGFSDCLSARTFTTVSDQSRQHMRQPNTLLGAILLIALFSSGGQAEPGKDKASKFYFPPSFAHRSEATVEYTAGETSTLNDDGLLLSFYLPADWKAPESGDVTLTIHFHNPESFAVTEHARRGLKGPLLIGHIGSTTPAYQNAFKDKERFGRWIKLVEGHLKEKGAPSKTHISTVDISSYGAGYGAVREILELPENVKLIRRLVLCDSMYASYAKNESGTSTGVPIRGHIDPWVNFAKAAAKGEKTFVLTYSQILPTGYASTAECASIIMSEVGGSIRNVELDSCAAANDLTCALLARGDVGNFHTWGYAGNDVGSRMMHPWHLGDIWRLLDGAGEP